MHKVAKIAVVGCGYWGKNLIRNFSELGVLAGICDSDSEVAESFAQQYQVVLYSVDQIVTDASISAVVIATPAITHFALAKLFLESGKHVFVEKPLALNTGDAEILVALAESQNRILMVGHLMQYHPAFITLKNMIEEGVLGKINYISSNRMNLGKLRTEENILWSFAPHDISMVLALTGERPHSVRAVGHSYLNHHVEDVTTTHLSFPSGTDAMIHVSWLHPHKVQELIVVGSRGMAVLNDCLPWSEKLCIYKDYLHCEEGHPSIQKKAPQYIPLTEAEPLKQECQTFIDSILTQTQPVTNGEEGLSVLSVLNEAQQQLAKENKKTSNYYIHETATVHSQAQLSNGVKVWHYSHVMQHADIGDNTVIGQNVFIGNGVAIGRGCKIQNNVSVYAGVTLADNVFCGPSCVFTNVINPRAHVERKDEFKPTYVETGVTIGANATIVCGNRLGAYCMIGAGAVVTHDVKPYALMVGVPAKQVGWVTEQGDILDAELRCPTTGARYNVIEGQLVKTESLVTH